MTAQTVRPGTTSAEYGEGGGRGMLIFAAVVVGILGFFNLLDGISAVAKSNVFIAGAHYVVGDLRTWGITAVVIGGLQLLAAAGVVVGNQIARWFAVAVLGINAIAQMFFIPSYPFWSVLIIAVDVVGLYALCAYGGKD
jgi:hypothetical protein